MNNFDLINWDSFSCLDQMPGGIPIPSAAEDSNQLDFQWGVDLNRELNSQELLEAFERSISRENVFEEKENIEKVNGEIQEQKGAQKGPGQIEIRKGNSIQISLDEQSSGWIGTALFHTNPIYRQETITSPDGRCPFSIKGPGNVLSLGQQEVDGAGPAFVQAVQLENQDKIDISFNVISSHACSKYHYN